MIMETLVGILFFLVLLLLFINWMKKKYKRYKKKIDKLSTCERYFEDED